MGGLGLAGAGVEGVAGPQPLLFVKEDPPLLLLKVVVPFPPQLLLTNSVLSLRPA